MNKEIKGIKTYDLETDKLEKHVNCIYCYINKINGKRYIGQTNNIIARHRSHVKGKETLFDKKLSEYGETNFLLVILKEDLKTSCLKDVYERYYIEKYNTVVINGCGYNIFCGGSGGNYWITKTEEEKEKIKEKLRQANLGKKASEETRQKLREVHKGKTFSEEYRKNLSIARKKRVGENAPYNRGVVALNKNTGESFSFMSIKEASLFLEEKHKRKYYRATISKICSYNHDPEKHKAKYGSATTRIGTGEIVYTFFYVEDFEQGEVKKVG